MRHRSGKLETYDGAGLIRKFADSGLNFRHVVNDAKEMTIFLALNHKDIVAINRCGFGSKTIPAFRAFEF
jgi:hypothetical protein